MKDNELRGLFLKKYYEHRKEGFYQPEVADFTISLEESEIVRISEQLDQHDLINWESLNTFQQEKGHGEITALGIDVIEGEKASPVEIKYQNITISSSSNIQIGDQNIQDIKISIENIISSIESSSFSPQEKNEAKSKLKEFLKHPVVASILGATSSTLIGML